MPLSIGRSNVEQAGRRVDVREALEAIGAPPGEHWQVEVVDEGAGCQVVVDGPCRLRAAEPEWHQGTTTGGRSRYRRRLCGPEECTPRAVRTAVRRLVWESIEFRENALSADDAEAADKVETAAWELLSTHDLPPLTVRVGSWRGESGARRFVCKVEAKTLGDGGVPPWRWWSPILADVDGLSSWLQQVLDDRGVRPLRRVPASRPPVRSSVQAPAATV